MSLVNEVNDKMCKRTRRLIRTVNKFFSVNEPVGTVAE